jgi:cell wall-associated NlpC family hydrolase
VPATRTAVRPDLSPREIQALREALAVRQALAAGRPLTAEQAAVLRTAAATIGATPGRRTAASGARKPSARTSAARQSATRKPARKPVTRTSATRTPAARKAVKAARKAARVAARAGTEGTAGFAWRTRIGLVAASAVLLPALATIALTGPKDATTGGPQDATSLALTAQSTLLQHADRYRQLQHEAAQARADLTTARAAEQAALTRVDAEQQVVGTTAADLYRSTPEGRVPGLALSVHDADATGDVLFAQAVSEREEQAAEGTVARAERAAAELALATARVTDARAALDEAGRRAEGALAAARHTADGLGTEVSLKLAALGTVPVPGPQQARNARSVRSWQGYLGRLAAAGIEPPVAADMRDPADLPAGFAPALDAAGRTIPGVVWAVDGNRPVTVLPAETIAAVSSALSQLGKPFVAGTAGPESYDCGGFTSATWLLAGYAVPATPEAQWAAGAAVPVSDLQVGDLVFSPGGQDVGIYLGGGNVVGASAGTYQVAVRSVTAGSSAVRVTLPAPAEPNAALAPGGPTGPCGAALPEPGQRSPKWGGWSNGQIPSAALCELGVYSHALRCDAAASYQQLSSAYRTAFGHPLCITDSYRSLGAQVAAFYSKPALAAVPGTSNHGWALAVDLCDGINVSGTPQWTWMTENAGRFGFVQPEWAGPHGPKPEPWHWEYGYIS